MFRRKDHWIFESRIYLLSDTINLRRNISIALNICNQMMEGFWVAQCQDSNCIECICVGRSLLWWADARTNKPQQLTGLYTSNHVSCNFTDHNPSNRNQLQNALILWLYYNNNNNSIYYLVDRWNLFSQLLTITIFIYHQKDN